MIYLRKVKLNTKKEIDWKSYPMNIPALRNFQELSFETPVTFFVGENGIESHSDLYNYLNPVRGVNRNRDGFFLRAESFYNAISYMYTINEDHVLESSSSPPIPPS